MDPIEALKEDHRKVEQLIEQFEMSGSDGSQDANQIVKTIIEELTLHTQIEEKLVYPFISEQVPELEENVLEAIEEHQIVKNLLKELKSTKRDDERLKVRMKVLKSNVLHHVQEEENEVFPKVQESCGPEDLEELGERLEQMKMRGVRATRRRSASKSGSRGRSSGRKQGRKTTPARSQQSRRRAA